jgi:hypothetical protein
MPRAEQDGSVVHGGSNRCEGSEHANYRYNGYVADISGDLIVMGADNHSRLREIVLGGMTRDMRRSMTVPVLMAH